VLHARVERLEGAEALLRPFMRMAALLDNAIGAAAMAAAMAAAAVTAGRASARR
jgi:hypothetical protein